jgi:acyl transferase domain-containing protein
MEAIAIIGMSCRLPGANNLEAFWTLLSEGIDAISEIPSERWPIDAFYDAEPGKPGKMSSRWAGLIDNIDCFDAEFFGISPREAKAMDPQQRLALELTWEALEDAAIAPTSLAGSRTSVFMGAATCDYHRKIYKNPETIGPYQGVGTSFSIVANRISYLLNLRGVSTAIDTACSSSLVAVHLAGQSLLSGESDLSLVGGVNAILSPEPMINFSQARMMATDGHCRTFDAQASGYVRGEGGGIVVLKRLSDALRDGDIVRAVINGTAVNQDGLTNGLTAPNGLAQQAVIEEALARCAYAPAEISYVETHGTGTPLGDPIEVRALKTVLSKGRTPEQKCWFGSVKTNIGHLEAAAGIASLIKVVLSLENDHIPPHLHLKDLNPYISLKGTPFAIPTEGQSWLRGEQPRRAGVSAFGYGGTNAHVIVSEAPVSSAENERDAYGSVCLAARSSTYDLRAFSLFTLSAKSTAALAESAQRYAQWLDSGKKAPLADICYSVNIGRTHFKHRLAATAESQQELQQELAAFAQGKSTGVKTGTAGNKAPKIAFLFSGQGSQYLGMAEELYRLETPFQASLDRCAKILDPQLDRPLLEILYGNDQALLDHTLYTQPALFALEYALSSLWQFWGIEPKFVCGHSLGEYVAACVAGVISLEDALTLVVERSRLMQSLPLDGGMVAVFAGEAEVAHILHPYQESAAIAAVNAPQKTTISGRKATLKDLEKIFNSKGIETRPLAVSHAFHSPLLEPILDRLEEIAHRFSYHPPQIPLISNLTGDFFNPQQAPNGSYWREHSRQPVRFAPGINRLLEEGCEIFLEIGPRPTLSRLGKESSHNREAFSWLPSLVRGKSDWQTLLASLSALHVKGASVNWTNFEKNTGGKRVCSLPSYPFQRQRYWWEEEATKLLTIPRSEPLKTNAASADRQRQQEILATLQSILGKALEIPADRIDPKASLLEIGADSIIFIDLGQKLEKRYGIQISLRQLFEDLKTIEALSNYIDQQLPPDWKETPSPAPSQVENPVLPTTATEQIITQQMQMMQQQLDLFSQQLQLLGGKPSQSAASETSNGKQELPIAPPVSNGSSGGVSQPQATKEQKIAPPESKDLSPQQQRYLEAFIDRYTQRTAQSKQRARDSRTFLADRRASVGFRRETKELLYPIVGKHFAGGRFWDIDGNEYVDISMGFGVHLFGHRAPFLMDAIAQQLETGAQTGPQSPLAAEVARSIVNLTGMDRVCFSNSGTEAVMTALRLARAVSGRHKIVMFKGAYHGHFDGTLAVGQPGGNGETAPMAAGILPNMVADVLLLNYNDPKSLEIIRSQAGELAAVLVEPIPSRQPDIQPQAFLQQLREVTRKADIALIFDEVITGFRLHPGGAQAWFQVEADLATYGKALGGGMPIGVVAGKSKYLDAIDGGNWHYGDDSFPEVETTFFAGTFSKHPLAMAAAHAVLQHLESQGGTLQAELNQQTETLTESLQCCFDRYEIPMQILRCGSIFRFRYGSNSSYLFQPLEMDLFYYHLIEKGIYIWEGRTCFLSTAHNDRDREAIVAAVEESLQELRSGGFFQGGTSLTPLTLPLTDAQRQLWLLTQMAGEEGSLAYIVSTTLKLQGKLNRKALDRALHVVVNRHEALRTRIDAEGKQQKITKIALIEIEETDISHLSVAEREVQMAEWFDRDNREPFNLAVKLPLRVRLLKVEENLHLLLLSAHHILVDGWSMGVIVTELGALYRAKCQGEESALKPALQWSDYTSWLEQQLSQEKMQRRYWLQQLSGSLPVLDLPSDRARPPIKTYLGDRETCKLESHLTAQVQDFARSKGCTPFMVLLSVYLILLHRLTGQEDILIGIPAAGRSLPGSANLVGYCAHLLPIRSHLQGAPSFQDYLAAMQETLLCYV